MEDTIKNIAQFKKEMQIINKKIKKLDPILNSVGCGIKLSNINDIYEEVPKNMKKILDESIERADNIITIDKLIQNLKKAVTIEAGIYEFALVYSLINNIDISLIPAIYNDKLKSILCHCDTKSHLYVKKLHSMIIKQDTNLQLIAFMQPHEMNEDVWIEILKRHTLRDYYKENIASTDLYKCRNCGESKTQAVQVQTRSCDEPMTIFITCLVCKNRWKKC